jgi:elongation factor Tu
MDKTFIPGKRAVDKPFLMMVDGSVNIPGRGIVATGTIEQGKCKVGDEVNLIGIRRKPTVTQITGLEAFRKSLDYGEAGDSVGCLLKGLLKE